MTNKGTKFSDPNAFECDETINWHKTRSS